MLFYAGILPMSSKTGSVSPLHYNHYQGLVSQPAVTTVVIKDQRLHYNTLLLPHLFA
jgi:hypothetical protein